MPSPITKDDFESTQWGGSACEKFKGLLQTNDRISTFLDWLLGDDGELSDEALQGIYDRMMPIGAMIPYAASSMPSDKWLPCLGQSISRTGYPALFALIGTSYGSGDGTTTFNIPDWRDRAVVGAGGERTVGTQFGEDETVLTMDNIPEHTHPVGLDEADSTSGGDQHLVALEEPASAGVETDSGPAGEADPTGISVVQRSMAATMMIKVL